MLALLSLGLAVAVPQVEFSSTLVKVVAGDRDAVVPIEWHFSNVGDEVLAVEALRTSCGCLTKRSEEIVVAPGERGTIAADFNPKGLRGLIRKSLWVKFVNLTQSVELVAAVTLPDLLVIEPRELNWQRGQTHPQRISVRPGLAGDFDQVEILSVPPQFTVRKIHTPRADDQGATHHTVTSPAGQATSLNAPQESQHPAQPTNTLPAGTPQWVFEIAPNSQVANPPSSEGELSASDQTFILQIRTNASDPRDQIQALFLKITAQ